MPTVTTSWHKEEDGGRRKEGGREEVAPLLQSKDLHLAGVEDMKTPPADFKLLLVQSPCRVQGTTDNVNPDQHLPAT